MNESIVIPSEDQTGLFLESPMTNTEEARLAIHEAAYRAAGDSQQAQDIATWEKQGECLLAIYQEGLFRSSNGGRGWEAYLAEATPRLTPNAEHGFGRQAAMRRIGFFIIRRHLSSSAAGAGGRDLPTWLTQIDEMLAQIPRANSGAGNGWAKFQLDDPSRFEAVEGIWQGALLKARDAGRPLPTSAMVAESRRAWVANPANQAARLSPARQVQLERVQAANRERYADPQTRTISPADLEQARADAAAREERESAARREATHDAATGTINPLTIERGEGDLDAFDQCRKYHGLMITAYNAVQSLEAFVESKARTHGADFFGFLRQVDAGSWSVASDLQTLARIRDMVQASMDLAEGTAEPPASDWQDEPTMVA